MRISVIGSGYVGLVAAACFAEMGHDVLCVDEDPTKIKDLNAGGSLIHEDYLCDLLERHRGKNLRFSISVEDAVRNSLLIFIAVGTPSTSNGAADLSYVESVTKTIAKSATEYRVVVEKSTVPVYTSEWIERAMILNGRASTDFDVVSNPEFLREGSAVTDFLYPDRIVVGTRSHRAGKIMRELYSALIDGTYPQQASAVPPPNKTRTLPVYIETSPQSAELIKHSCNAFLALKISFINAISNLCESVGADIEEVSCGIGADQRIGSDFLRAGIGYGGSCFPKDISAFRAVARDFGCDFRLLDEISKINHEQRSRFLNKVRIALWTLKGKKLGVLGLAFKGGTDDIRESPAMEIIRILLDEDCQITVYDPAAMARAREVLGDSVIFASDSYAAAEGAEALLILTEWQEFASLDLVRLRTALKYPIILDGRNLYSLSDMERAGLNYYSVGRRPLEVSHAFLRNSHSIAR